MKKTVAFTLIALTLLLLCLSVSAATSRCIPSKSEVRPGETFTVSVELTDSADVKMLGITPKFDGEKLELISGEWRLNGAIIADFKPDRLNGVAMFTSPKNTNGAIFTLTFLTKPDAKAGKTDISAILDLKDGNEAPISATTVSGTVKILSAPAQSETAPNKAPGTTPPGLQTGTISGYVPAPTPDSTSKVTEETVLLPAQSETAAEITDTQPKDTAEAPPESTSAPTSETPPAFQTHSANHTPIDPPEDKFTVPPVVWVIVALAACFIVGLLLATSKKKQ